MMVMYSTPEACRTLDPNYMTPYLKFAQWVELIKLKEVIIEVAKSKGKPIDILEIGIGEARLPIVLAEIEEIWKCISRFDGIDNSDFVLAVAKRNVRIHNISDKINIRKFDARNLKKLLDLKQRYDLVICTYFTAGNFPPDSVSFNGKNDVDISEIKNAFQRVFKPAFDLVRSSGELVLGSVYIDNFWTVVRQREFYEKCGMTVIRQSTPFTATKEGFWSLRFTEERIRDFFDWIDSEKISLIPLDTDDFAMMVRIKKTK